MHEYTFFLSSCFIIIVIIHWTSFNIIKIHWPILKCKSSSVALGVQQRYCKHLISTPPFLKQLLTASYLKLQLVNTTFKVLQLKINCSNLQYTEAAQKIYSFWLGSSGCICYLYMISRLERPVGNLSSPERFLIERSLKMYMTLNSGAH